MVVSYVKDRVQSSQFVAKLATEQVGTFELNLAFLLLRQEFWVFWQTLCIVTVELGCKVLCVLGVSMQIIIVRLVLSNATSSQPIRCVVWVRTFAWLIFHSAVVGILTGKDCVTLQRILIIQPVTVEVSFTLHRDVNQLESSALPPVVTSVNKFVNPSVEATFLRQLPLCEPLQDLSQV